MTDCIVVQNDMTRAGLRRLHLMSNQPIDQVQALRRWAHTGRPVDCTAVNDLDETRIHHLRAEWRPREAMYYTFRSEGTGRKHPVVVWALEPGQRISAAAVDAALIHYGVFQYWPSCAWVRTWPRGLRVEDAYIPLTESAGLDLFAVSWAMDGFVIVGGTHV